MSKSYSKIRHMQEANEILDRRFLNEVKTSTTLLSEKVTTQTTTVKPVAAPTQAPTGIFTVSTPNMFGAFPTQHLDIYVNKVADDNTKLKRTAQLVGSDGKGGGIKKYTGLIPFTKGTSPNFNFAETLTMYPKFLGSDPGLVEKLNTFLLNLATNSPQV